MRRLFVLFLTVVLAIAGCGVLPAFAGPTSNYFSAYDFRYETAYNCGTPTNPEWVCYAIPYGGGYASYFNAPGLNRTFLRDSIGGRTNSQGFVNQPNQNAGVMCWQLASNGSIWLLIDDRQPYQGSTALFVGWVPDADIVLSRVDRLNYVPECGYIKTAPVA